jgi:hypothetical protein
MRRTEINTFPREHSINRHNSSEIIPRTALTVSHKSDPPVPSISEKSIEPTTKLADSSFFLNDPYQSRKIDIKQTSILEFIG